MSDTKKATNIADALTALSAAVHAATERYAGNLEVLGYVLEALTQASEYVGNVTSNADWIALESRANVVQLKPLI